MSKATAAVGIVLLVVFVAFGFVTVIGDIGDSATATVGVSDDDRTTITTGLDAAVNDTGPDNATVTLIDTGSGETVSQTLQEGETLDYAFADANATVTVTGDEMMPNGARLTVTYPRTFGMDGIGLFIAQNATLLLAVLALVIVGAALTVAVRA